jgi:REP element-mobilizing transposase RayT
MPNRDHLRRLPNVWMQHPIYFLTVSTHLRRPILTQAAIPDVLVDSWRASPEINGWSVGRYVVMPDHVHFFAQPTPDGKTLSDFLRDWKRWTGGRIGQALRLEPPLWQREFFDHILRSAHSYDQKWDYVRENPVRAGLAARPEDWPHAGECELLTLKL